MDLDKLNSATKYPSILTYHAMGDRGRVTQEIQVPFPAGETIHVTEKVDGTNGRIVVLPQANPRRYIIGSREEFLYAHGDLIRRNEYGIVKALEPIAEALQPNPDRIWAYFFEVFGAGLPAAKQYTSGIGLGVRIFDVVSVGMDDLAPPIEKIAAWRDHGGQWFAPEDDLEALIRDFKERGIALARVPSLGWVTELPTTVEATYEWLKGYARSSCDLGGGLGRAEGIVARNRSRKAIAKIRFEDYERTLGVKRTK